MIRRLSLFLCVLLAILLNGCSSPEKHTAKYPRKPDDTSGRKAGAAMLLYEQAEKDMDVNDSVIVTPPTPKSPKKPVL